MSEATATMDFFGHQDEARKKTSLLVFYFILAVGCIMLAVYAVVASLFLGAQTEMEMAEESIRLWNPELFMWVMLGTLLVVGLGTLYKISQLSQGGASVARLLGGRHIGSNAGDRNERRILNVVEEMAIASGTPVPPVYILENEVGINAFAAGFSPTDAVIGVTRGCIEKLSRDELQGVVAHEFSHILNGDMRLNIRLMGVLHGILVIALIGFGIIRVMAHGGRGSRGGKDKGGAMIAMLLLGVGLLAIGYIGVFFGKLIKSAVSRQREYLADASAVQFTRNPLGIGGALKKIAGYAKGSKVESSHAEEASHFFFSNGLTSSFTSLMATHPPLKERIRRLDPQFIQEHGGLAEGGPSIGADAGASGFAGGTGTAERFQANPTEVVSNIGAPKQAHLEYATSLIAGLPPTVASAAREPFGARAVIYGMLLNKEKEPRRIQILRLEQHADYAVYDETKKIMGDIEKMGPEARLPLADMAIASLRSMSERQYKTFIENVEHLIAADKQVDLFEYAIQRIIKRHLDPVHGKVQKPKMRYTSLAQLADDCAVLLSSLAYWGSQGGIDDAKNAFTKGAEQLTGIQGLAITSVDACGLEALDASLEKFVRAAPQIQKVVLQACVACVGADGYVTVEEGELLRAVADSMDCPIPPFLPGQKTD